MLPDISEHWKSAATCYFYVVRSSKTFIKIYTEVFGRLQL